MMPPKLRIRENAPREEIENAALDPFLFPMQNSIKKTPAPRKKEKKMQMIDSS
jgi:hypothetical protein